ncbi:lysophosphatidylserine lipase ABHD12-like isoform X2 [Amblyomma americanum]
MLRRRILHQATAALKSADQKSQMVGKRVYLPKFKIRKSWIRVLGCIFLLVYGAFPAAFYFSGWFRRFLIFGHYLNWPPLINFTDTHSYELPYTRSFFLESTDGIMLGTWHIMPKSQWARCVSGVKEELEFNDNRPVIIYYHGHAETRAADYRVQLYKRLSESEIDAHVITFDYRGFGDSTNVMPSRSGVIEDSLAVYNWVKKRVPKSRIIVWGHSLGTGVVMQLAEIFTETDENPAAIVLEAPFNSLVEAALRWPLGIPFRYLPVFSRLAEPLRSEDTNFESEQKARKLTAPVLVMHSKDDPLVPYDLGQKLLSRIQAERPAHLPAPVFYEVDRSVGPGHRRIYKDSKFPSIVSGFIQSVAN